MSLKVFDTLRDDRIPFTTVREGKVGMYVCGLTVQGPPHVGHMRAAMVGDLVHRSLRWLGYDVTFLNNFTDVDDKIIVKAAEDGVDYTTVAERNIESYFRFVDLLGMKRATLYPRVTQHIPEIQTLIATLIQKGVAYAAGGDVYFRVEKFQGYGKLSKRKTDELRSGSRIEPGEQKESPLDFALWKAAREGEPYWDSPWGRGRPGWHIECSAMAMKYLGECLDLHGGGIDLIFPHHENEIAQSEAATGRTFSNFWVHNGLVLLEGTKMSKSTKHFYLAEEISNIAEPATIRYYLLSTHYRSPIDFSQERLDEAGTAFSRIRQTAEGLNGVLGAPTTGVEEPIAPESLAQPEIRTALVDFRASIEDDFNSAGALGHLFSLSRTLNRMMAEPSSGEKEARIKEGYRVFHHLVSLLGLDVKAPEVEIPEIIRDLARQRGEARAAKEWGRADEIRKELTERGWVVEDRGGETVIRPLK
ncbi:MAG: cysteine--tRNA ligase [Candidatus Eisenbacteria bacterium]|nr:cysteine--tRNA ligase [Candidatus Eisenbacteria bacterium]MCC7143977.1 cysteine--tRNA ligase [Candidatus Eisenbacteria bacterium]